MTRIFITSEGKLYKADEPQHENDMEKLNPSQEQLDGLPNNGEHVSNYTFSEQIRLNQTPKDACPWISA